MSDEQTGGGDAADLLHDELLEDISASFAADEDTDMQRVVEVVERIREWERTGNPFFVDRAFELTVRYAFPITATLGVEMVRAIHVRRGDFKGTFEQVRRWEYRPRAYLVMCNLIFHGCSLAKASSIAAHWLKGVTGDARSPKNSTLEQDYVQNWRRTGIEDARFAEWKISKTADDELDWKEFERTAPQDVPELWGKRR